MKILFLSNSDPNDVSFGSGQRSNKILQTLKQIARVDVIVTCNADKALIRSDWGMDRILRVATRYDASRAARLSAFRTARRLVARALADEEYDFIVARYFGRSGLVPFGAHAKLVIDGDDVSRKVAGASPPRRVALRLRAALIRSIARRIHRVWLVDPRDREVFDKRRSRITILPNTARAPVTPLATVQRVGLRLLMVGLYSYLPNEEGLKWFAHHVLPGLTTQFPGLELHAVGQYHQLELNALSDSVLMRGFVEDLGAEYVSANAVICPIFSGSGTQIKVIEALMHGRPTVVSDFSFQGFADVLKADTHLLVARNADEWVSKISSVLRDPAKYEKMAEDGRRTALAAYNEDAFAARVIETFRLG